MVLLRVNPKTGKRRGGMPAVEIAHGAEIADSAGEDVWNWSSPAGQARLQKRVAAYKRDLGLLAGTARLLELGCGTGLYTEQLAPYCREIVAVDISDALLAQARARLPQNTVRFVRQNVEALDPSMVGADFDGVYGCSVLHHLDLDRALPLLKLVLKPGANLVFSEPNLLNPQVQLMFSRFEWARRKWATSETEMAFYPWELRSIVERHGFEVVSLKTFDFMHPAIPAGLVDRARSLDTLLERLPGVRLLGGSCWLHARLLGQAALASARPATAA